MSKTVRLPEEVDEELTARKRPDETMAEMIARHLRRPHPAETRAFMRADEAVAVEEAIDGLYADADRESDRLARAHRAFEESAGQVGDET